MSQPLYSTLVVSGCGDVQITKDGVIKGHCGSFAFEDNEIRIHNGSSTSFPIKHSLASHQISTLHVCDGVHLTVEGGDYLQSDLTISVWDNATVEAAHISLHSLVLHARGHGELLASAFNSTHLTFAVDAEARIKGVTKDHQPVHFGPGSIGVCGCKDRMGEEVDEEEEDDAVNPGSAVWLELAELANAPFIGS